MRTLWHELWPPAETQVNPQVAAFRVRGLTQVKQQWPAPGKWFCNFLSFCPFHPPFNITASRPQNGTITCST